MSKKFIGITSSNKNVIKTHFESRVTARWNTMEQTATIMCDFTKEHR